MPPRSGVERKLGVELREVGLGPEEDEEESPSDLEEFLADGLEGGVDGERLTLEGLHPVVGVLHGREAFLRGHVPEDELVGGDGLVGEEEVDYALELVVGTLEKNGEILVGENLHLGRHLLDHVLDVHGGSFRADRLSAMGVSWKGLGEGE